MLFRCTVTVFWKLTRLGCRAVGICISGVVVARCFAWQGRARVLFRRGLGEMLVGDICEGFFHSVVVVAWAVFEGRLCGCLGSCVVCLRVSWMECLGGCLWDVFEGFFWNMSWEITSRMNLGLSLEGVLAGSLLVFQGCLRRLSFRLSWVMYFGCVWGCACDLSMEASLAASTESSFEVCHCVCLQDMAPKTSSNDLHCRMAPIPPMFETSRSFYHCMVPYKHPHVRKQP